MKIYIAGHAGLVGSAIVREVERQGVHSWIGRTRGELNLLRREDVKDYLHSERPDAIVVAAAKVGGILANLQNPVDFLSENLQIQTNIMDAAAEVKIDRLLFLGSSCIYPKMSEQPIPESALLTGPLEETNESYAIAKIAGVKLAQAYKRQYGLNWNSAMPTNIYGPGDNFHPEGSHVIPGLIGKFHKAVILGHDTVELWGSGTPLREFIHVDDLAKGVLALLESDGQEDLVNIGSGEEVTILQLATEVARVTGFEGEFRWNKSRPDGTPRKILDSTAIRNMGWSPEISLQDGLKDTYRWFLKNINSTSYEMR